MKYAKVIDAYSNSEKHAAVESNDPHLVILVLFEELLKCMRSFDEMMRAAEPDKKECASHFSRSLTILYALQSSLDFEKGGEIANNLFRLYEYARQQLLSAKRGKELAGLQTAIWSLTEIQGAWEQIGGQK